MHGAEEELTRLVEGGKLVHICRESIVATQDHRVRISDGASVRADAVVFATSWEPSQRPLFEDYFAAELGLPVPVPDEDAAEAAYWRDLNSIGETEVLNLYPLLRHPPRLPAVRKTTPYRLFRTIASPKLATRGDNSLAFVGLISNNQVASHAEISGLWAVSFLTSQLYKTPVGKQLADQTKMDVDIAKMNVLMEKRYLGRREVPDAAMEIQDYTDLMMRDMGLRHDRKTMQAPASWFGWQAFKAEYLTPYMPRDYLGIVAEFLAANRSLPSQRFR